MNLRTVTVYIKRNADGVVRATSFECCVDQGIINTWIWEEGNYACDCNRKLEFERVVGHECDESETPCGHDGYSVRVIDPVTHDILYDEWDSAAW